MEENYDEYGCPDCECCTYCGPGPDNDCPFNERLGDSVCPCTCA